MSESDGVCQTHWLPPIFRWVFTVGRLPLLLLSSAAILAGCHASSSMPIAGSGGVNATEDVARAETARAFDLIQQQKYADAEPVLKRALEADPLYGPAHNNLGLIYHSMDRPYDAARELEKAIKLMPRQPEPHTNLGLVLEKAGKLNDALLEYTLAEQLGPDTAEYLGNLARARLRLGLRDEETRRVLESLIQKETRPQWLEWAKLSLRRLKSDLSPDSVPATLPAD